MNNQSGIRNPKSEIMRVLLIEHNHEDARLIEELLAETKDGLSFDLECAERLETGLKRIAQGRTDVVLLDLSLPDAQGLAALIRAHAQAPGVPVVVLSDLEDGALAAKAVQNGAQDYLVKDQMDSNLLLRSLRHAIERHHMLAELEQRTQESQALLYSLDNIIQKNPDGIIIVDRAGVVRFVNPAAESLLNRKSEKLMGEMLGFPIVAGKKTDLDIIRKGGEAAKVEMHVVEMEWKGEVVYLASLHDITEHKKAEERLRESEERYRTLLETSPDLIAHIDKEGRFITANPAMAKSLGVSIEELAGKTLFDAMPKEVAQHRLEIIRKTLDERQPQTFEDARNGRQFQNTIVPIIIPGQEEAAQVIARDITGHKKAEEALRESEEKYRSLVDSTEDSIYLVDRNCKYLFMNQENLSRFGLSIDKVIGKTYGEFHSKEEAKEFVRKVKETFKTGKSLWYEYRSQRDDRYFIRTLSPVKEPDGRPLAVTVVSKDITERKRTEEALKESEERYRTLFEDSTDAVCTLTREGRLVDANQSFSDLFGYTTEEIMRLQIQDLYVNPSDGEGFQQEMEQRGSVRDYELKLHKKDGTEMDCLATSTLWRAKDSSILGYRGIIRDVTEQKCAQEELKRAFIDLAETISRVVGSRDPYTSEHQQRVAKLARLVGERMGLDKDKLQGLSIGGLLHDIGKVSIPASILTKSGELSGEEWSLIYAHTKQGYNILKDTHLPWPVADMALHHHERLDGSGYPHGLSGDKLSLEIRILGVCDVVEAMSSYRPYRPARSMAEILEEVKGGRGVKYDPDVVDIVLQIFESGEFEA